MRRRYFAGTTTTLMLVPEQEFDLDEHARAELGGRRWSGASTMRVRDRSSEGGIDFANNGLVGFAGTFRWRTPATPVRDDAEADLGISARRRMGLILTRVTDGNVDVLAGGHFASG